VNIDKHRVLPVITTVVDHTQVTCRFPNGSRIESYGGRPHIWLYVMKWGAGMTRVPVEVPA